MAHVLTSFIVSIHLTGLFSPNYITHNRCRYFFHFLNYPTVSLLADPARLLCSQLLVIQSTGSANTGEDADTVDRAPCCSSRVQGRTTGWAAGERHWLFSEPYSRVYTNSLLKGETNMWRMEESGTKTITMPWLANFIGTSGKQL